MRLLHLLQVDKDEYADEDGILFSNIKFYTVLACPPLKVLVAAS